MRLGFVFLPFLVGMAGCPAAPSHPAGHSSNTEGLGTSAPVCQRSEKLETGQFYAAELSPNHSPFDAKDACAVSEGGLAVTGDAVLAGKDDRPALPTAHWNHKALPAQLAIIDRRFALTAAERAQLLRDGFVVSARLGDSDYVTALHEIFQSQLPLYISADAILHAIYASNDKLLAQLEATLLLPRLDHVLEALHCALPAAANRLPKEVAKDVDLYLTVARSLLAGKPIAGIYGQAAEAEKLIARAQAADELAEYSLFGRKRMIDFTLYRPRGHYASESTAENPGHADLSAYFRAAMWLSHIEFNVVSRSCISSQRGPDTYATPHEAAVGIALGRIAAEAKVVDDLDLLDRAWGLLAGKREDVPLPKLAEIAASKGILSLEDPELAEKLRAAIGNGFARTARTHYTWEGCAELPVISTMLGPRVVADAAATRPLVHSETPDRHMLHAADMAYALGHERALVYLADDLQKFPNLRQSLDRAQKLMRNASGDDLYSAWLTAIRKLADPLPAGAVVPSFMQTAAFSDLHINSAVAAFGQLRHNYVLMAAQTYDEGGCAIPDAFIEPVPAVYDALIAYAERGAAVMRTLDNANQTGAQTYFQRLAKTLRILSKIAKDELQNRALSDEEKRFLGMVVEVTGSGRTTGGYPTFTGWYFDLFRDRRDAFSGAGFIADYYTSTELSQVAYAGVSEVRMGVFIVDTAGPTRAVVGPVARAFEQVGPLAHRLTDADAVRSTEKRIDPWANSYTAAAPPEPPLTYFAKVNGAPDEKRTQEVTLKVFSTRPLGPVTIELLDHHRLPLARVMHPVSTTKTEFHFPARPIPKGSEYFGYEGVHLHVGDFDAWELSALPQAQSGAPRIAISEGDGHVYGGMPKLPSPPPRRAESP